MNDLADFNLHAGGDFDSAGPQERGREPLRARGHREVELPATACLLVALMLVAHEERAGLS